MGITDGAVSRRVLSPMGAAGLGPAQEEALLPSQPLQNWGSPALEKRPVTPQRAHTWI